MSKKQLTLLLGVAALSLASTSMAAPQLAFGGYLNQNFYVSGGSTDAQYVIKTPPTITVTGGQMQGGIAAGTTISAVTTNQSNLYIGGSTWPATVTVTYTATVGSHGDVTPATPYTLNIDSTGSVAKISSTIPEGQDIAWSADGNAACELYLTQPSTVNAAPSYPTLYIDCGDRSSALVKRFQK